MDNRKETFDVWPLRCEQALFGISSNYQLLRNAIINDQTILAVNAIWSNVFIWFVLDAANVFFFDWYWNFLVPTLIIYNFINCRYRCLFENNKKRVSVRCVQKSK